MSDTYRSGGKIHSKRNPNKPIDMDDMYESTASRVMDRAGGQEAVFSGQKMLRTDMEQQTAETVTERAGGSGLFSGKYNSGAEQGALGGEYKPTVAQTSLPAQSASMGASGKTLDIGGGGMSGGTVMDIGKGVSSMNDEQEEANLKWLQDDSDLAQMQQMREANAASGGVDVGAMLARAKRFGKA